MLLKRTSNTRGKIPGWSCSPVIVYVFPELVTPYANNRPNCI